jgi:hypothetical protein
MSVYDDDEKVGLYTEELMQGGRTVFQLWQLARTERDHSELLLKCLFLPPNAHVVSLGCGVGGMEAYWQQLRPDLRFTLINRSQAQLDLCLCEGTKVLADLDDIDQVGPIPPCDLIVMAYMLGHVDAPKLLARLGRSPVLLLDVVDTTPDFNKRMDYQTIPLFLLLSLGFSNVNAVWHPITDAVEGSTPVWMMRGPG